MIAVIANPQEYKPDNLRKLDTQNTLSCKLLSNAGRTSQTNNQTGGYAFGNTAITVGSTAINTWVNHPQDTDILYNSSVGATTILTTYNGNTPQMRVAVPVLARAGATISSILVENIDVVLAGTGVTGTLNVRICKMTSGGTVTTIATASKLVSASESDISIVGIGSPVTMASGDYIVIELEIAQTSGTHNGTNYTYAQFPLNAANAIFHIS